MRGRNGGNNDSSVDTARLEKENIVNLLPRRPVVLKKEKR